MKASMVRATVVARWTGLHYRTIYNWIRNGTIRGRCLTHPNTGRRAYYVHGDDARALRDGAPLASAKKEAREG